MNILKAIETRQSIRGYAPIPLSEALFSQVEQLISSIKPGPFGTTPQLFIMEANDPKAIADNIFASYGLIRGAQYYIGAATEQTDKHLIDLGYVLEGVVIAMTQLGIGTCWLGGTFKRERIEQFISAKYQLSQSATIPILMPFGLPEPKVSFLDRTIKALAQSKKRMDFAYLFFDAISAKPLIQDPDKWWTSALEAVRKAPSAVNKQPWRVYADGEKGTFHFYIKGTSMVDIGIAMAHFQMAAEAVGLIGNWKKREGVVAREALTYIMTWEKL